MTRFEISPIALDDLLAIWRHIAQDSEFYASRYVERLRTKMRMLSVTPGAGRIRTDFNEPNIRGYTEGSHLILYRTDHDRLEILRVIHSARDTRRIKLR